MHLTKLQAEHKISGQGSRCSIPLKFIHYHPSRATQLPTMWVEKVPLGILTARLSSRESPQGSRELSLCLWLCSPCRLQPKHHTPLLPSHLWDLLTSGWKKMYGCKVPTFLPLPNNGICEGVV